MTLHLAPGSRVVVVGGGVVGVSSAYALSQAGLKVTVVTAGEVGDGATSGNAGLLVPADSVVWPGPANAKAVPATLIGRGGSSIRVAWKNPRTTPWGLRFLASSTARQYARSTQIAHSLSRYSLALSQKWVADTGLNVDITPTGMVFLLDGADGVSAALRARRPLVEVGEAYRELSRGELEDLDPAYAAAPSRVRALYAPGAAQGDSQAFARALADQLTATGSRVLRHRTVRDLKIADGRVAGIRTAHEVIDADVVVLAAGTGTARLARTAGIRLPILPVKGYAATVGLADEIRAPRVGGVLESRHVAYSRTRTHIRLSTGAEIGRADHDVTRAARAALRDAADHLFPDALDWTTVEYSAEHRPMTPTGLPVIGPTALPGLAINSGHGSLGWTQAAGSADLLTRQLMAQPTPVDPRPFLPPRARRTA